MYITIDEALYLTNNLFNSLIGYWWRIISMHSQL